ncbi:MAG: ATP-binding protein [Alphaproteobacteria bacterium]|nr:ATP-binding protein [Alphaproteobacteria bacterium]
MKGDPLQFKRIWRPLTVITAPAAVVLVVLWLLEVLPAKVALVAFVLLAIGTGFMVRLLLTDLTAISAYAEATADDATARRPRLVFGDIFVRLLVAIRRLSKAVDAKREARQLRAGISGLDHLPDPVLMLDRERRVVSDNAAARELLGGGLIDRDLAAVIRNPAILDAVDALLEGGEEIADVEFSFQVPVERYFSARIARVTEEAADPIAIVIALHDMTVLKRAEQMRSDFVANASHELRTPISVILGCVQTLRTSARDDAAAQAEFTQLMEGQAERMGRLVDDLLSLSGIEQKEHAAPSETIDMRSMIDQLSSDLELKAAERGIAIEKDWPDSLPDVVGDKDDLYRALQNLVDNALKYGAEGSTVTVSARMAEDGQLAQLPRHCRYLAVSVRDQGEGIAPEHLPRLTERFYRIDTARSRQLGGTGLGLAIVKHVANRHRGALMIDSTPGEGSVFTLILPVEDQAQAGDADEDAASAVKRDNPESA